MVAAVPGDSLSIDRRVALAHEWSELVARIRQLDGYRDFLRPPRLEQLLPAAAGGPVVIVNVSRWRCDAIIVSADGVQLQQLPGLTLAGTTRRVSSYLRTLDAAQRAVGQPPAPGKGDNDRGNTALGIARHDEMLSEIAEWLWDVIADPVLSALGLTGTPGPGQRWPRLWWCPTGLLTLLPLHAAGYHNARAESPPRTVADRVVSSYTPTLRALLDARTTARPTGPGRLLIVALPDAPGQGPISDVTRERDMLAGFFPGQHTILQGPQATREAVMSELPRHRWAHFACHGHQDLTNPSHGGLILHGRTLTVTDLGAGSQHGEFAFLSACKTATSSLTLPDEAINLASALHYTGYRHVIGTLWSVADRTASTVATEVYADLASSGEFEPERAAYALHAAVRKLRDKGSRLITWTPFIHTGP